MIEMLENRKQHTQLYLYMKNSIDNAIIKWKTGKRQCAWENEAFSFSLEKVFFDLLVREYPSKAFRVVEVARDPYFPFVAFEVVAP